jgi:hypothetical protein
MFLKKLYRRLPGNIVKPVTKKPKFHTASHKPFNWKY